MSQKDKKPFHVIYLGESGVLILAFIISYIFVKISNDKNNYFLADEIFMIMALPGIDMFRLFILRIYNGKHPFSSDTKHIHHLVSKHFSKASKFTPPLYNCFPMRA